MDSQEARLVLQARRPNDLDTTEPAFAEALALVETDRELKAWWEAQQTFDRKVAAKIEEIEPPDDLRETILSRGKIHRLAPQPFFPFWLSAAAAVAILCAVAASFHAEWDAARHISTDSFHEATLAFLGNDTPALGMMSPDHDKVMAWLKDQQSPTGDLPEKMSALPTVGCQKIDVQGHSVSLICFNMAEGKLVHLFVVHSDDLADPPTQTSPQFQEVNGWSTATWSDGPMSYMLATQAGEDALRQLL
jgi:anti-sigma factor RsiW